VVPVILLTIRIAQKKQAAQEAKPAEAISGTTLKEPGKREGKAAKKVGVRRVILSKAALGGSSPGIGGFQTPQHRRKKGRPEAT